MRTAGFSVTCSRFRCDYFLLVALLFASVWQNSAGAGDPPLRCGSHCLYVAARLFDHAGDEGFEAFESKLGQPSSNGYSIGSLKAGAEKFGLHSLAVATTIENLLGRKGQFACIAHMNGDHFVLVQSIDESVVRIIDPPRTYLLPLATFAKQWNGAAVLVSDAPLESEDSLSSRMRRTRMTRNLLIWGSVFAVIILPFTIWRRRYR